LPGVTQPDPASHLANLVADLRTITEAQAQGKTWAEIGATLGMTGPDAGPKAKREAHRLREQVKQELQALSGKLAAAGARNGGFQPQAGDGEGLGCGP